MTDAILEFHPLAEKYFPLMQDDELAKLVGSIKANGLREPIIVFEGKILDSRNRYRACLEAGVEPTFRPFCGDDPVAFVIDLNLHRRHLTAEQRRELIAKLLKATPEKSNRQIADQVKADHKTVGTIRAQAEARGEIPHVEQREDSAGRRQPARKTKPARKIVEKTPPATTHLELIAGWNAASPADRTKAIDAIGLEALLDAIPPTWLPLLAARLATPSQQAVTPEVMDSALVSADGGIPLFLDRRVPASPVAVEEKPVEEKPLVQEKPVITAEPIALAPEPAIPPAPTPKTKRSPTLHRDPLKVNWRRLDADDLEVAICDAQHYGFEHADEDHEHKQARLRQLDRMRKSLVEARATEKRLAS
jgi:hypothetical protein